MKNYRYVTVLLTILGCIACNTDNKQGTSSKDNKYEPLPVYFKGERSHIGEGNYMLRKTVALNGQTDTTLISGTDSSAVQDLLKPFAIDLNKPSLRDEYDTSSLYDPFSGRKSVIYKSKGKQTFPSEITMDLDKNSNIQQVNIHSYTSNMIYEFRQDLSYQRNKSMRIATYQKIAFLTPKQLEINVAILPKTGI
ncbi:MAG TPA: hypothetical protein VM802_01915 [Chitinophaga sp.]|uniref:hypothetical protein n=1 Tax=Chitinophaga sp. TaxID=1869181 RepID=UPI002BB1A8F2|nr:hypothetical protein [Chitinophaga sp.]HVI43589.1 hypothetical protein [Chitinophaga sp.]